MCQARILFVSESNVCRSVLAEAIMRDLIAEAGWESLLECSSAGSRGYNVGDPPDPLLVAVAEQLGLRCAIWMLGSTNLLSAGPLSVVGAL